MELVATVSDTAVRELLSNLADREIRPALAKSLSRAATTVRAEASRNIATQYALTVGYAKSGLRVENRLGGNSPNVLIRVSGKPISLIRFGRPVETRRGVAVTVKRGGRSSYPGAFIATGGSGNRHVFWRERRGGKLVGRLPIVALRGPSLAQIVGRRTNTDNLLRIARERITTTLVQEINYRLTRVPTRFA